MGQLLIKWAINTAALLVVVKTVKGLAISGQGFEGIWILALASGIIGLINAFIRPVIILLTLPLNILSFGLFTLVINGVIFYAAGFMVRGFEVTSLWGAIIGSLLYSLITMLTGFFIRPGNTKKPDDGIKVEYKVRD
ncbi:MAG: phage holin family protein [Spirochaetia bacterium]|nr:phage holin family protein [Spirochaetia bacterium]